MTSSQVHGSLAGNGRRFAVVVARFHEAITRQLLEGARRGFLRHGVDAADLTVAWVPGSFELPLTARQLAGSGRFAAVVCLGCVIRGETSHFDQVCAETARGIMDATLATGVPVVFGVLTCDTEAQARARVDPAGGHKGVEAASTALEMASLLAALPGGRRGRAPKAGGDRRPARRRRAGHRAR
jgi:6,7-dimethyl-8-ribityllumazine synthase